MGVLQLILSETPLLPFNVTRYTTALTLVVNQLKPANATVLSIKLDTSLLLYDNKDFILVPLRNAINDFGIAAEDFVRRSKTIDTKK